LSSPTKLAHIQRLDPFVNVFQVCVETLLFYHPAVWWLNKRIRAEREHAATTWSVALCGNAVEYARALTLMEEWRRLQSSRWPRTAGPLTERIVRVLGLKTLGAGMRASELTAAFCVWGCAHRGMRCWEWRIQHLRHAGTFWQAAPKPAASAAQPAAQSAATAKPSAAHRKTATSGD